MSSPTEEQDGAQESLDRRTPYRSRRGSRPVPFEGECTANVPVSTTAVAPPLGAPERPSRCQASSGSMSWGLCGVGGPLFFEGKKFPHPSLGFSPTRLSKNHGRALSFFTVTLRIPGKLLPPPTGDVVQPLLPRSTPQSEGKLMPTLQQDRSTERTARESSSKQALRTLRARIDLRLNGDRPSLLYASTLIRHGLRHAPAHVSGSHRRNGPPRRRARCGGIPTGSSFPE